MSTEHPTSKHDHYSVAWRSALVRLPRAVPAEVIRITVPEGPQPFLIDITSRTQSRIPVYAFVPVDLTPEEAIKLPVILDFHGGGFYLGSCLEQAPFCAMLARKLRVVTITVDYRLGPKYKYPAAVEDAEDVLRALIDPTFPAFQELRDTLWQRFIDRTKVKTDGFEQIPDRLRLDKSRIAISGFSSGGNLALNLALSVAGTAEAPEWPSPFPPDYQHPIPLLLFYPSFDARQLPSERSRPVELPEASSFWGELSDKLAPSYLPRDRAHEPRASPGLADLAGLHPQARIFLVLTGIDDLAEQSEVWVQKMADEGKCDQLKVARYPFRKHGWTQMPESWLNEDEQRTRLECFIKAGAFTKDVWNGKDVADSGNVLLRCSGHSEWRLGHYDQILRNRKVSLNHVVEKSAHPSDARRHLLRSSSSLGDLSNWDIATVEKEYAARVRSRSSNPEMQNDNIHK